MKDKRGRQLRKASCELDAVKPLLLTDIVSNLPRIRSRPLRKGHRVFSSCLGSKPHTYVYVHAAHIIGNVFVVNGDDVKFYDSSTLQLTHIFDDGMRVSPANIATIYIQGCSRVAIGCSANEGRGYLVTWDLAENRIIARIDLSNRGVAITAVSVLDKHRLIVGDVQGRVYVVTHDADGTNLRLQGVLRHAHDDGIYKLAVAHNSGLFAATSVDNTISVWDAAARECIASIPVGDYVNVDINARYLACAGSGRLRVYSIEPKENNGYSFRLAAHTTYTVENVSRGWNGGLKLLPDGLVIVGGAGNAVLTVLDIGSSIVVARYAIPFRDLVWLDITPDARLVLSSGEPQYGIHAILDINQPKRVVEAFQLYAQQRNGTSKNTKRKQKSKNVPVHTCEDNNHNTNRAITNAIVGTAAKSILFCICIRSVRFALRRLLGGAGRRQAVD